MFLYKYHQSILLLLSILVNISSLSISIPWNLETIFQNGEMNPYFNSTFFLPSCTSLSSFSTGANTYIQIDLLPTDSLPNFTMYINEQNSKSYFTLLQIEENHYQISIENLCRKEEIDSSLAVHRAIYQKNELEESTNDLKIVKFYFMYNNEEYNFYIANICSEQRRFQSVVTFILLLIIYCIIIYLVTIFQIDFQIANFIHSHTRLKWWAGPIVVGVLSVGILLLYYFNFVFWIVNFVLVGVTGLACTQVLNWLMTEVSRLEFQSDLLTKIQKCLLKEICCKQNLISLICSLFFKLVFIIWVATQSVVLGNLMVFCFIFVVISSIRVTKFKNCFWLLLWIIIYEIVWKYCSQKYFKVNLNLLMSQRLTAPDAIQIKNYQCWKYIYISEIIFPGVALKFCGSFDEKIKEQNKRSYYICGFILIILAQVICFIFEIQFYYLLIVMITLIFGLALKSVKDGVFKMFWKGEEKKNIFGEVGVNDEDSDDDDAAPTELEMVSKTELKHFI